MDSTGQLCRTLERRKRALRTGVRRVAAYRLFRKNQGLGEASCVVMSGSCKPTKIP